MTTEATPDPTPKTHIDPYGAEFAIACLYCGRVHRTRTERRDMAGQVVMSGKDSMTNPEQDTP